MRRLLAVIVVCDDVTACLCLVGACLSLPTSAFELHSSLDKRGEDMDGEGAVDDERLTDNILVVDST